MGPVLEVVCLLKVSIDLALALLCFLLGRLALWVASMLLQKLLILAFIPITGLPSSCLVVHPQELVLHEAYSEPLAHTAVSSLSHSCNLLDCGIELQGL